MFAMLRATNMAPGGVLNTTNAAMGLNPPSTIAVINPMPRSTEPPNFRTTISVVTPPAAT